MHVTLLQSALNTLHPRALAELVGHHWSVITEPDHRQQYPEDVSCLEVESLHNIGAVAEAFTRIQRARPVDRIAALYETGQPAAGYLHSRYAIAGIPFDIVNTFTNKLSTKLRYGAAGLPTAKAQVAHGPAGPGQGRRARGLARGGEADVRRRGDQRLPA